MPYRADRGALVKPADEMEQQREVTHVATQLFPVVVLSPALTTLVPVAAGTRRPCDEGGGVTARGHMSRHPVDLILGTCSKREL